MKERGQALLMLVFMIALAAGAAFYTFYSPASLQQKGEEQTSNVMRAAKEALIGYAASSPTLPGQFPCPDMNNDGVAEASNDSGCPSGQLGRLPWKTLGLDDLRDNAGERLWYATSVIFTKNLAGFACPSTDCLDSDTKGQLTVYQETKTTVKTNEAVAIIFAPGPVLPGQLRNAAGVNNPVNYLDIADNVNNATPTLNAPLAPLPSFISAQPGDTFNDRLLIVETSSLWPIVEKRIARDVLKLLTAYRTTNSYYPWAASNFDDDSNTGTRRGMAPMEDATPTGWSSGQVPSYIKGSDSKWGRLIYYAIAECASSGAPAPPACGTLTVDGVSKDLVIIMPGPAGASRPSTNLADYFEDGENRDNDDQFVTPSSTAYARDRIYFCPGTPGIC